MNHAGARRQWHAAAWLGAAGWAALVVLKPGSGSEGAMERMLLLAVLVLAPLARAATTTVVPGTMAAREGWTCMPS